MNLVSIKEAMNQQNIKVSDIVMIKDLDIKEMAGNRKFGLGYMITTEFVKVPFKIWGQDLIDQLSVQLEEEQMVFNITGKTVIYKESFEIHLESLSKDSSMTMKDFLSSPYNKESYTRYLLNVMDKQLSEKGQVVFNGFIKNQPDVMERFYDEFSAKTFHDNVLHGLLAHTSKMLMLAETSIRMYPHLFSTPESIDLLFLGIFFHDIGKIKEMKYGVYTDISFASHRLLGVEIVSEEKELIVTQMGEAWYYQLLSVIMQHHGEYEERPRTPMSMIVHFIDSYEAQMTGLNEKMQETEGVKTIKYPLGSKLAYLTKL